MHKEEEQRLEELQRERTEREKKLKEEQQAREKLDRTYKEKEEQAEQEKLVQLTEVSKLKEKTNTRRTTSARKT